jgi:phenylalanyl-tRNA synthetase alpha subunit
VNPLKKENKLQSKINKHKSIELKPDEKIEDNRGETSESFFKSHSIVLRTHNSINLKPHDITKDYKIPLRNRQIKNVYNRSSVVQNHPDEFRKSCMVTHQSPFPLMHEEAVFK